MNDKHSVLIVEDDDTLRQALAEKFTTEGFVVWEASNGDEAFPLIEQHLPEAVLLDLVMQDGSGIETLKKMRHDMPQYTAPVVVLTNTTSEETIADVMQYNVHTYLVKSDHSLSDIVSTVKQVVTT
jgi:DNA-binding response OmpR family regulator